MIQIFNADGTVAPFDEDAWERAAQEREQREAELDSRIRFSDDIQILG